jgi:hypothetical protein
MRQCRRAARETGLLGLSVAAIFLATGQAQQSSPQPQNSPPPTSQRQNASASPAAISLAAQTGPPQAQPSRMKPCPAPASPLAQTDRNCVPMPDAPDAEKLARFSNSGGRLALTPAQKLHLAMKNTFDPFNLASIGFFSAIDVATDPHGPYGPGMAGWARDSGTSLTEDINGQFWSTFVVASIGRQDPHYHRMPQASIKRRILHTLGAVVVAQSDAGKTIPNYDLLIGSPISASINNLYVPYARTNVASTADRVLTGFAFEPIGNAVTEFLPDVARRVNIRIVFVQKIINRVYEEESGGATLQ